MSFERQTVRPNSVPLPEVGDFSSTFWLTPQAIERAGKLINRTHLSTMALGVETHSDEAVPAHTELHDIFIHTDEPLSSELKRAIDVGFMYGSLIGQWSADPQTTYTRPLQGLQENQGLPEHLGERFKAIVASQDTAQSAEHNAYRLFMRLRDTEVLHAKSDVLAFSLALTQDHMRNQFSHNREGESHNNADAIRLQSLYYAGALVGALLSSDPQRLELESVQILRSVLTNPETITARLEFEPSDNLADAIEYSLATKLALRPLYNERGMPVAIAALPGSMQFGPNSIGMPLYLGGQLESQALVQLPLTPQTKLFAEVTDSSGRGGVIECIDDPVTYLSNRSESAKIVGMLVDDNHCLGVYDSAHPYSSALFALAGQQRDDKEAELWYSSTITMTPEKRRDYTRTGFGFLGGLAIVTNWLADVAASRYIPDTEIHWSQNIAMTGIVLGALGALAYGVPQIKRTMAEHEADFDRTMVQSVERTLGKVTVGGGEIDPSAKDDAL